MTSPAVTSPFDALRRLSAASVGLLLTRAEFASLELAQSRAQLMRWLGMALAVAVLALLSLMAASALLVGLLWSRWGWGTLLLLALAYLLGAAWLVRRLQREIAVAPPLLAQTLQELSRDREALLPEDKAAAAGPPP